MSAVSVSILLFLLAQLAIGFWASRRVRAEADFLVAGRRLGAPLAGLSLFATWFGAESVLGASSAIRDEGLAGGRADPLGYAIALIVLGLFLAARLWRTGAMTLADVFRDRFGPGAERVAAIVMIPTSVLWGAAQIRAFGQILAFQTPLSIEAAIVLATAVAIVYTGLGGLWGDVVTDAVQAVVILVGLIAMLIALMWSFGGPAAAWATIEPSQLTLTSPGEPFWSRLDTWAVPVVGALVAQEAIARLLGCRSERGARSAALMGGGMYLAFGAVPVLLGLLGAHYAVEAAGDEFIPALARSLLSAPLYVLFVGALLSAILSTVDSTFLAIGALASHNLLPRRGRDSAGAASPRSPWPARAMVVLGGAACCVLALRAERILDLVLQADSVGVAGIVVVTIVALFTKWGGPASAIATLGAGLVSGVTLGYFADVKAPFAASLAVSAAVFAVVAMLERAVGRR